VSDHFADGLGAPVDATGKWEKVAWKIGVEIAAPNADDVDRNARFPHESVDAFKESGLLSALLPTECGGGGASLIEIAGAIRALAVHCASSALVLAMHSTETFFLARHGTSPALLALAKEVATENLLIANANSEVGMGGDIGRSICALDTTTNPMTLDKQALAVSYGEYANLIFTTARRSPEASDTDQISLFCRPPGLHLEPTSEWDSIGLRGTCSRGFRLTAEVSPEMIFPTPFAMMINDGGSQSRQLLMTAVWVGLAEAAAARAHSFVREAGRRSVGTTPPVALRLAEMATELQAGRSLLVTSALRFDELDKVGDIQNAGYVMAMRSLKVSTSSLAIRTATGALAICGIEGYRRDSPFSMDRIVRDSHGGVIMGSNERNLQDNAQMLLARKQI
jgi:acyl-CoA dehydrogenase